MLTRLLTTVQNTDLFKPRVRTRWKARLADRQLSSMHVDNPYIDKNPYNYPKHQLFQATVRTKWKTRLAERQLSSMHFDKSLLTNHTASQHYDRLQQWNCPLYFCSLNEQVNTSIYRYIKMSTNNTNIYNISSKNIKNAEYNRTNVDLFI